MCVPMVSYTTYATLTWLLAEITYRLNIQFQNTLRHTCNQDFLDWLCMHYYEREKEQVMVALVPTN
jgi:hypothetical protein